MHISRIFEVGIVGRHKLRGLFFSGARGKVDVNVCSRGLCLRSLGRLRVTDVRAIGDYFVTPGDSEKELLDLFAVD